MARPHGQPGAAAREPGRYREEFSSELLAFAEARAGRQACRTVALDSRAA